MNQHAMGTLTLCVHRSSIVTLLKEGFASDYLGPIAFGENTEKRRTFSGRALGVGVHADNGRPFVLLFVSFYYCCGWCSVFYGAQLCSRLFYRTIRSFSVQLPAHGPFRLTA